MPRGLERLRRTRPRAAPLTETVTVTAPRHPQPALLQRFSRADLFVCRRDSCCWCVFAAFASDSFLTQRNLIVNISRQLVTNGFPSLGMLMVIRTGGIDLSVSSVLALAGLLATGLQEQMHFSAAIAVALAMGAGVRLPQWLADGALQPPALHRDAGDDGRPARSDLCLCGHAALPCRRDVRAACSAALLSDLFPSASSSSRSPCLRLVLPPEPHGVRPRFLCARRQQGGRAARRRRRQQAPDLLPMSPAGCSLPSPGVLLGVAARHRAAQRRYRLHELDAIAAVVIGGAGCSGRGRHCDRRTRRRAGARCRRQRAQPLQRRFYYQQLLKGLIILVAVLARRKKA